MAIHEASFSAPISGAPYALNEPLPNPGRAAEQVVTVTTPVDETEHRVQIYSSAHPRLGPTVMTFAQELHTQVYLEREIIDESELNELGLYVDEYSDRAVHYYVKNGTKVAASRTIHSDKKKGGLLSLPTLHNFEIDPKALCEVAGVDKVSEINHKNVVEISGLASRRQEGTDSNDFGATLALYARMIRDSLESNDTLWVANVEKGFLRYLNTIVGRDNVKVLGPEKEYMGPATRPIALSPHTVVRNVLTATDSIGLARKEYLKEVLAGVSDKNIPKDIRKLLRDNDIHTSEYPAAMRLASKPANWFHAAVFAYSASRALPSVWVDEFNGNTAMLWGIDIGTTIPYSLATVEAFKGKTIPRKLGAAVVASACFVAPYAYFGAHGEDYPWYVGAGIGTFMAIAAGKEFGTRGYHNWKSKRLKPELTHSTLESPEAAVGSAALKASLEAA